MEKNDMTPSKVGPFKRIGNFCSEHKRGCIAFLIVALVAGFMFGTDYIRRNKEAEELRKKYELYKIPDFEKIDINGVVTPKESKQYAYPENNSLSDISIENGQEVTAGSLLFTTKDDSVSDQLSSLKSQLSSLNSQKVAASKNNSDPSVIASINSQISSVESQISSLSDRAYVKHTAPFNGKVYINDQNSTDTSKSFISLVSNEFYMKGQVSEEDLSKVQIDQTVKVQVGPTGEKMTGRISYVSDRPTDVKTKGMNPDLSYYDIHVTFENQEGLVNGYHVDADLEIVTNEYEVPSTAVVKNGNEAYIMKNLDGILKKQIVSIVKQEKGTTTIATNLEPGDTIIKSADKTMKEGDAIPAEALKDKSPKIDKDDLEVPDVDGKVEDDN